MALPMSFGAVLTYSNLPPINEVGRRNQKLFSSMKLFLLCAIASCYVWTIAWTWRKDRSFLKRLQSEFPAEWQALGSPGFNGPDREMDWSLLGFIISGQFRRLDDAELNMLGKAIRNAYAIDIMLLIPLLLVLGLM